MTNKNKMSLVRILKENGTQQPQQPQQPQNTQPQQAKPRMPMDIIQQIQQNFSPQEKQKYDELINAVSNSGLRPESPVFSAFLQWLKYVGITQLNQ